MVMLSRAMVTVSSLKLSCLMLNFATCESVLSESGESRDCGGDSEGGGETHFVDCGSMKFEILKNKNTTIQRLSAI